MLVRMGWVDAARMLFGRMLGRFRRQAEMKALVESQETFYAWLKHAGYPSSGSTIMVFDAPADRARFVGAIAFALHKMDRSGTPPDD